MFYMPSFRIYGGVAGFYDYGPPGCAIKQNIQQFWRQHFVIEEGMLEVHTTMFQHTTPQHTMGNIDTPWFTTPQPMHALHSHLTIPTPLQVECPAVTPEPVLRASGHVERFTDLMVTDVETGDCHRADHLLENALEALLEDRKNPPSAEEKKVRRGVGRSPAVDVR